MIFHRSRPSLDSWIFKLRFTLFPTLLVTPNWWTSRHSLSQRKVATNLSKWYFYFTTDALAVTAQPHVASWGGAALKSKKRVDFRTLFRRRFNVLSEVQKILTDLYNGSLWEFFFSIIVWITVSAPLWTWWTLDRSFSRGIVLYFLRHISAEIGRKEE